MILITVRRFFLLREVADDVGALLVDLAQDVEEERVDVEVERFVVEKELGHEAQVLTIELVLVAVHLEDGQGALAVDFFARRLPDDALARVVSATSETN